ncbi:hypothetical protein LJK88_46795 [Paenibacillus sp. P26]|nr:hypothetical protein LJK88_46795 [Paenibacillus sp. P26]
MSQLKGLDWSAVRLLVVPAGAASALSKQDVSGLLDQVNKGLNLITEKPSDLAAGLGLTFQSGEVQVGKITNAAHPDVSIEWEKSQPVRPFTSTDLTVFDKDRDSGNAVTAGGKRGQGKYVYLSVPLDEESAWGYSRLPFFHEVLTDYLGMRPEARRNQLTAYLDWGYYYAYDPVQLADRIKSYGINEIHLSAWYDPERVSDFYTRFMEECHRNGIRVYAWLEYPMVSAEFWNAHPEWREKTATGEDAHIDWRQLMALQIPECLAAVKAELKKLIDRFDWDGIDLAELYFESPGTGVADPSSFTPMNDAARKEFQAQTGIDPKELLNPDSIHYYQKDRNAYARLTDYRANLSVQLNREFLQYIQDKPFNKTPAVTLTQIDSVLDPRMREQIGVDSGAFTALQKEFGFTLRLEDPYTQWALGPDRYRKLGTAFRNMIGPEGSLSLDVNVVDRAGAYPTRKQTGLEFLALLSEATANSNEVCLYTVSTPTESDFRFAANVLADQAEIVRSGGDSYQTAAPYSFLFETVTEGKEIYMDGSLWPLVSRKGVWVPKGDHTIQLRTASEGAAGKLAVTEANLDFAGAGRTGDGIYMDYASDRKSYASLSQAPGKILIDGEARRYAGLPE